ncbi:MAG: type II toxin-antitoxin system Phd/YefM family antitoxin [Bryobacteraceae bacterium]|nr:type II toxin-antitoxin system Phd/YefM family antitoxin [Bryobacteraceae bacterium]
MPSDTTYTNLRQNLASILDKVSNDRDVVIVRRRQAKDVALVAADELTSLLETAHLLRSPRNAERLLGSLSRAKQSTGKPKSPAKLRREFLPEKGL